MSLRFTKPKAVDLITPHYGKDESYSGEPDSLSGTSNLNNAKIVRCPRLRERDACNDHDMVAARCKSLVRCSARRSPDHLLIRMDILGEGTMSAPE